MTLKDAKDSLSFYLVDHEVPGPFLTAILANDLREAVRHADPPTLMLLRDIVQYAAEEIPLDCQGSWGAVCTWFSLRRGYVN